MERKIKVVVWGDIHGRSIWKQIVEANPDADLFIALGDYHDVYLSEYQDMDFEAAKISSMTNLFELLDFKRNNPDKVIFLLGNHDIHYLYEEAPGCSRFDRTNEKALINIFCKNKDLFQASCQIGNHFFCHAGVTNDWLNKHRDYFISLGLLDDLSNLDQIINSLHKTREGLLKLIEIGHARGGYSNYGGPFWADSTEFQLYTSPNMDSIPNGLHQYVGHNKVFKIEKFGNKDKSITFLDVLHKKTNELENSYLKLEL